MYNHPSIKFVVGGSNIGMMAINLFFSRSEVKTKNKNKQTDRQTDR